MGSRLPPVVFSRHTAPSNHHLFRSMAHAMGDQHFRSYEGIKKWINRWVRLKRWKVFSVRDSYSPRKMKVNSAQRWAIFSLPKYKQFFLMRENLNVGKKTGEEKLCACKLLVRRHRLTVDDISWITNIKKKEKNKTREETKEKRTLRKL